MIKVHAWYLVENVRKIDQNIFISLITILAKSKVFNDICKKKKIPSRFYETRLPYIIRNHKQTHNPERNHRC